jgi:hypothetical protein
MTRGKLVFLSLVAVLGVSMTASISASAHRFIEPKCEEILESKASQWSTKASCETKPQPAPTGGKWRHKETPVPDFVEGETSETATLKAK